MEKLSSLALPPVQGRVTSAIASQVSGRTYKIDGNDLKIETIALHITGSGWTVGIKTAMGEETLPCGYGMWEQGQATVFNDPWMFGPTPVFASGAWTAEESFTLVVRLYETPFFHTLVCHFVGDEMLVETWVNVSLEAAKRLLLTAQAA